MAYSCIAAWGGSLCPCTAALELSLRNLPPRQPSNPSRQLAGQPATLGILDRPQTVLGRPASSLRLFQACLFCSYGLPKAWGGSLWNVQPVHCSLRTEPSNPSRQLAGQPATLGILDRPQTVLGSWQACLFSSPVPGLPLLFLWASESNVRHFGPPSNPSQRLWPTPASQPGEGALERAARALQL